MKTILAIARVHLQDAIKAIHSRAEDKDVSVEERQALEAAGRYLTTVGEEHLQKSA